MARETEQSSEIVVQLAWLTSTYKKEKWVGLLAGLAVAMFAIFVLGKADKQDYMTRIIYGTQPKMVKSQFDQSNVMRLAPVIPKQFTVEQIMKWHTHDFVSFLKKVSSGKYKRLKDVGFGIEKLGEGYVVRSNGKFGERKLHESFHKEIVKLFLEKLHEEEKRIAGELASRIVIMRQQLAGIEKSREVITAEQEQSVRLMEKIIEQTRSGQGGGKRRTVSPSSNNAVFGEARPDDGLSNIILALTKKREELTDKSEQTRHALASYARLGNQITSASVDVAAMSRVSEDVLSFGLKLAIWLFLVFLAMLVAPFLWALVHSIASEMKS